MDTYIHKTDQRLRIRSDFIKQNPDAVTDKISMLQKIDAIKTIKHKKHAGSVAITFNQDCLQCAELLTMLEDCSWTKRADKHFYLEEAAIHSTKTFAKGVASVLLSRMISPSISRLIFN